MVTFYKYHPPDRHSHRRHRTRCCMTFVRPEAYIPTDTVIKADRLQVIQRKESLAPPTETDRGREVPRSYPFSEIRYRTVPHRNLLTEFYL